MVQPHLNGVVLHIYAQPNAHKNEVVGEYNNQIKIKIKSPPIDGKANNEIISFLSEIFNTPQKNVHLLKGDTNRSKTIFIEGVSVEFATQLLNL